MSHKALIKLLNNVVFPLPVWPTTKSIFLLICFEILRHSDFLFWELFYFPIINLRDGNKYISKFPSFLKYLASTKGLFLEIFFFSSDSMNILFFSSQILLIIIVSSISGGIGVCLFAWIKLQSFGICINK